MAITEWIPAVGLVLFIGFGFFWASRKEGPTGTLWIVPAALSFLFLILSIQAIATGGLFGFWSEHTQSFWGNQVWIDLLLAGSIGWFFAVPRARALGMNPVLWFALIALTGSVAFLAMVARMLYLKEASRDAQGAVEHV